MRVAQIYCIRDEIIGDHCADTSLCYCNFTLHHFGVIDLLLPLLLLLLSPFNRLITLIVDYGKANDSHFIAIITHHRATGKEYLLRTKMRIQAVQFDFTRQFTSSHIPNDQCAYGFQIGQECYHSKMSVMIFAN